jgi:hypothetical protein
MANFKRRKPKLYWFVSCCRDEALHMHGNHPYRRPPRDLRQPQLNEDKGIEPEPLDIWDEWGYLLVEGGDMADFDD